SAMALVNALKTAIEAEGDEVSVPAELKPRKADTTKPGAAQRTQIPDSMEGEATLTVDEPESSPQNPALPATPGAAAGPRLYAIFEYLAQLVAERDADEPFMFSQIEPTLRYMAPDFNYAAYKLSGIKDFIVSGEKAGYFKLAEDSKGSYLVPGRKAPS